MLQRAKHAVDCLCHFCSRLGDLAVQYAFIVASHPPHWGHPFF
jgi:hypothetical protein